MPHNIGLVVFDTTVHKARIGLYIAGDRYTGTHDEKFRHIENLIPLIDSGLTALGRSKKDISIVAVCNGPGSFTGIRIGVAAAQAMALAPGVKSMGFSVFDVIRFIHRDKSKVILIPVLDAKKERYYCTFIKPEEASYTMHDFTPCRIMDECRKLSKETGLPLYFCGKDANMLQDIVQSELKTATFNQEQYTADQMLDYAIWKVSQPGTLPKPTAIYLRKSEAEIMLEKRNKK